MWRAHGVSPHTPFDNLAVSRFEGGWGCAQHERQMEEVILLSRREASMYLRVSCKTLARLSIPKVKINRRVVYDRRDLIAFAGSNKVMPMTAQSPSPEPEIVGRVTSRVVARMRRDGEDPEARYRRRLAALEAV